MSIYISASLLNDFISCNRKIYYRMIKPEEAVQNKEMIIGEIVHYTIENYWNNPVDGIAYLMRELHNRVPNEPIDHATLCLHNYYNNFQQYLTDTDQTEMKFKIPWDKDTFIVGKIDRISNGKVFDWKTDKYPITNISSSIQFILYNWAYKKMYNTDPVGVYYAALSNSTLVRYYESLVNEYVLFSDIIPQVIHTIKSKEYIRNGIFRKSCFRCQYSDICSSEVANVLDYPTSTKK